jgi:small neutral amino acid transporter SnatA (MarC family)
VLTLIAAAEPSKVPFFIAGGVLVVWAVVLSAIGLSRPEFPYNVWGQRGVVAISVVLALMTMAMAIVISP